MWRGAEMKAVSIAPINWSPVSLWASRTPLLLVVASVVILGLSTNEYQIFYQTHTVAGKDLIDASRGVLSGHPPWRAFQARLLGPPAFAGFEAVIEWGRTISPSAYSAFERVFSLPGTRDLAVLNAFVALMILAKNFVCFALLLRYSGSLIKAVGGTLLGTLLFVLLSNYWLYMWDLFELILFSFLAYMIFGRNRDQGQPSLHSMRSRWRSCRILWGLVAVLRDSPGADRATLRMARGCDRNRPDYYSRCVCNNATTTSSHREDPWVTRPAAFGWLRLSVRVAHCIRHWAITSF